MAELDDINFSRTKLTATPAHLHPLTEKSGLPAQRALRIKNRNNIVFRLLIKSTTYYTCAGRFLLLLTSFPGMLALRASCFILRLCLRIPLDGRLGLVLLISVFKCIAPSLNVVSDFGCIFCPKTASRPGGFLTGIFRQPLLDIWISGRYRSVAYRQ